MKRSGGDLNGFLDRGSSFKGDLEFEDTMRIDGRFSGRITSKHELIVGESAIIEADIHVGRIAISGTVHGTIKADERIEIHKAGRVFCDLETPALIIEEGATYQGSCQMQVEAGKSRDSGGPRKIVAAAGGSTMGEAG